jgi:hypothetical protein
MTTFAKRKTRIKNAGDEIDAAIRAVSVGKTPAEIDAKRKLIFGKVAQMPEVGDEVLATDLFEGTPFYGVRGRVTSDPAMAHSGVKWAKQRVMVRFESKIIGPRNYFPFPVAALAVAPKQGE